MANYLISAGESYGPTGQHIRETLSKSIFDSYQQVDYSVKHQTACCMESWLQSVVVIYFEKCV